MARTRSCASPGLACPRRRSSGFSSQSFVPGAGHVYATALALAGLDPDKLRTEGKGKNTAPPLAFVTKK